MLASLLKPAAISMCQHRPLRSVLCWRLPPVAAKRRVALTFDDGPHPVHSHAVLDLLAARSVRATFFVIGEQVERHPEVFQRILDDGHGVGIHGYVHSNHEMPRQTLRTLAILSRFGATSSLFRPPNGMLGLQTQLWMVANGFTTVLWSFDCRDSMRHEGKATMSDNIGRVGSGDIVLLHDDNPLCVSELARVLDHVDANRLEPSLLSDLFAA